MGWGYKFNTMQGVSALVLFECGNAAHSRIGGEMVVFPKGFQVFWGNAAMQRIRALVWIECKGGLHSFGLNARGVRIRLD